VYGVHVAACELAGLREHLRMSGLAESNHLARVARDQAPAAVQGRAGAFIPGADAKEYMYYPRRGPAAAGITRESAPRTQACADVAWLTSRSRGCLFIRPTGCAIHDVGEPMGLAVCRGFLCLTAFVFVVARDRGFTATSELACHSIADLHERVLAVLPRMADSVCSPEAAAASRERRDALAAAIDADRAGDDQATRAHLADAVRKGLLHGVARAHPARTGHHGEDVERQVNHALAEDVDERQARQSARGVRRQLPQVG